MEKLRKFTVRFGIITLVSLLLSCISTVLMLVLTDAFKSSIKVYYHFVLSLFDGSFKANSDILSYVSLSVLFLFAVLSLLWLILLLIKKKWLVFLYFILALLTGGLFSYALFLFADVTVLNQSHFYFKDAVALAGNKELTPLLLAVITLFLISITVCFVITFEILSIVYAYKQKKEVEDEVKVVNDEPTELKPVVEEENIFKTEVSEEVKPQEANESTKERAKKEERILLVKPRQTKSVQEEKETVSSSTSSSVNKEEDKEVKTIKKASSSKSGKVYHVSHHPTENKWQVKLAKGEKALKLFDTQLEAIQYAKEVSKSQGGSIRLHSVNGRIRKI